MGHSGTQGGQYYKFVTEFVGDDSEYHVPAMSADNMVPVWELEVQEADSEVFPLLTPPITLGKISMEGVKLLCRMAEVDGNFAPGTGDEERAGIEEDNKDTSDQKLAGNGEDTVDGQEPDRQLFV